MPREENRREMEYEAPTSSQRDSEVSNSYTGPENNPQDNNKVCVFKYYIFDSFEYKFLWNKVPSNKFISG